MSKHRRKTMMPTSRCSDIRAIGLGLSIVLVSACTNSTDDTDRAAEVEARLQSVIEMYDAQSVGSKTLGLSSIDDPLSQLGRKLFFTKAVGGEQDTACASCHQPSLGGADRPVRAGS